MNEISVKAFSELEEPPFVLDVREEWELDLAKLPLLGAHIPLGDLKARAEELPLDQTIYVICHHGVRSLKAALYLKGAGYSALSIKGGIDQYAREIDASVGFY